MANVGERTIQLCVKMGTMNPDKDQKDAFLVHLQRMYPEEILPVGILHNREALELLCTKHPLEQGAAAAALVSMERIVDEVNTEREKHNTYLQWKEITSRLGGLVILCGILYYMFRGKQM